MKNMPGSLNRFCDHLFVAHVCLDKVNGINDFREPIGISGREIIDDPDGRAVGSKSSDEMRANKSRASGYHIVDRHVVGSYPLLVSFAMPDVCRIKATSLGSAK